MTDKLTLDDILREDEQRLFADAVDDMRRRGFGEITLCFRNGYAYRVKVFIDSMDPEASNNNNKGKNHVKSP
jgi:hypothetical protein